MANRDTRSGDGATVPLRDFRPLSETMSLVVRLDAMTAAALEAQALAQGVRPEELVERIVLAQLAVCADAAMGEE